MLQKILPKVKEWLATIVGFILAAVFALCWAFGAKRAGSDICDDARERAEDERDIAEQQKTASESRQKRAERAEKKRNKFILPVLIFVLLGAFFPARAAGELYIPDNYAELREYYIELWDLCEEYRQLYHEAEASVKALQESNERLQQIIADQQAYIESLKRPRFGLTGGGQWTPQGWGANVGVLILF